MININEMSLSELIELKGQIEKRISELQSHQTKLVVYTHDCWKCANHHLNKYKHWAKLVTTVDTTKNNGFAFQGEFLKVNSENKVPANSIVVEVCGNEIKAYRITETHKEKIDEAKTNAMSNFIDNLAKLF